MTGKDLLAGLSGIDGRFIMEAEEAVFSGVSAEEQKGRTVRLRWNKALLAAAIIALSLLLVGCAVAYVLKMQDLKVGEQEATKPVFASDGVSVVGYETVNEQVLTLNGLKGTPGYQAALEWYEFKQEYDPDHAIQSSVWGEEINFPAEYGHYILYTQEMKDKLDAIMTKYSLKPLGTGLDFRTVKNMCGALGIEKLQTSQNEVTVQVNSGYCYSNGNFTLNLDFQLPTDGDSQVNATWGVLHWNRKDCFSEDLVTIEDTGDWKEWNYTTASGQTVLMIRSPSDWRGWILCDRGEALLALQIEARTDLYTNDDQGNTTVDMRYMSDRQMELVADAMDFGIQPRKVTQEDVDSQPAAPNTQTQDGYTVELKTVETDGYLVHITLGITAPEGTVISHDTQGHSRDGRYHIVPANHFILTPATGKTDGGSASLYPEEDNDGLDNTENLVLELAENMADGSVPFAKGTVWNLHMEDLVHSYWDSENSVSVEEVLAEGEWNFEIPFGEENGDYREVELITEPITLKAAGGMRMDGSDAEETVEVTSFRLRKFGASIEHNGEDYIDFSYLNGKSLCAVMKDGSTIQLLGMSTLEAESPIALDQVEYIQFADGTKLPVPAEALS